MDFKLDKAQQDIVDRAKAFVQNECDPIEKDWPLSDYDVAPELMTSLRNKFQAAGFRGMAIPKASGGHGLGTLAKSLAFEQFKQSWVLYGNVVTWPAFLDPHPALFEAPRAQQERYLWPILEGTAQYHICISEPDFGSDVASIATTAVRRGDTWVINGIKRWSPDPFHPFLVPNYLLVYAVTEPGRGAKGISTFLVDWPSDGVKVVRTMESVAPGTFLGKVCDLEFDNCVIPAENLLGLVNEGFHYVQDQLNRNRAVIGMGAIGLAQRCQDIAIKYAGGRKTFGKRLAEHQAIQWKIADSAMKIETGRLLAYKAAWKIDQGEDARLEAAMAKAYCPEMACRVIDRSIQILGGIGLLKESRLGEAFFQNRISLVAEGSVEMMKRTIARTLLG